MSLQNTPHTISHTGNRGLPGHGGIGASLVTGTGEQFSTWLFDRPNWLSTVPEFFDEVSDLVIFENVRSPYADSSGTSASSFGSVVSGSTVATSLFSITEDAVSPTPAAPTPAAPTPVVPTPVVPTPVLTSAPVPTPVPAPVPTLPGIGGIAQHTNGGGLPYSILRMLSEDPAEMPWSAAFMGAPL
ncbi:hypothetical protein Sste5346_001294 [Sporothrix stenoceras]|uniref:Uncharacterized protein n=1 Tax=Sporothrix stenoceras TaxID=5173 RepID=A0ABR3ZNN9_9PEZI